MSKITYNADLLKLMSLFETLTKTRLKDAFVDHNEMLTFVVNDLYLGKAIGKNASNVKKLEQLLKRKIKILGFNPDVKQFVKNLIYPITPKAIESVDNIILIKANDTKSKALLMGRNKLNLKNNLNITKKYFKEITEIKIN